MTYRLSELIAGGSHMDSQLADLALETFKASGPRTLSRLDELVEFYAKAYYGPPPWKDDSITATVAAARRLARSRIPNWMIGQPGTGGV